VSTSDHLAAPGDGRVSTGNAALDEILHGGLVGRRPYLIVGPSGTGKTTAALQFLCDGARRGERCLLVTLEEPPNEMKLNHPGLIPDLDRVFVFDAIPDIMRYERAPFKDISAVRHSILFGEIGTEIRKTPELSSVEVTFTALEQTLRMEMARRSYTRLVIDSLTALQYFCMKGVDEVAGAQTFLRFLSDLRLTTVLTVEAPLEDVETPERLLARGEIRLFRWEFDGKTVRAIGVEKFRGSQHDIRLHPYRIGPQGLDIDLSSTISRDTRQLVERPTIAPVETAEVDVPPVEVPASLLDSFEEEIRDLVALGIDVFPVRSEIESALAAAGLRNLGDVERHLVLARGLIVELVDEFKEAREASGEAMSAAVRDAEQRILARASETRAGFPPTQLPDLHELQPLLEMVLNSMPAAPPASTAVVPDRGWPAAVPPRHGPPRPPPSPPPPRLTGIGPPARIGVAPTTAAAPAPPPIDSSPPTSATPPAQPAPSLPAPPAISEAPAPAPSPALEVAVAKEPPRVAAPVSPTPRPPPPLPSFPMTEPAHAVDVTPPTRSSHAKVAPAPPTATPPKPVPAPAPAAPVKAPAPSPTITPSKNVAPVAPKAPARATATPAPKAAPATVHRAETTAKPAGAPSGTSHGGPASTPAKATVSSAAPVAVPEGPSVPSPSAPVSPEAGAPAPPPPAPRRRRRAPAPSSEPRPVESKEPPAAPEAPAAPAAPSPEPVPPIGATLEPVLPPTPAPPKKRAPRRRKARAESAPATGTAAPTTAPSDAPTGSASTTPANLDGASESPRPERAP
jgi:KaiC/GvpD/RAD55 family RecA-like ATPase